MIEIYIAILDSIVRILQKYINNKYLPVELVLMSGNSMLLLAGNIFDGALRNTK